ncbi:MAG: DUF6089 family protein [Bacteroidetes bacterium]|nr:DUF6089 family protein [Bacteroidota bacterium]
MLRFSIFFLCLFLSIGLMSQYNWDWGVHAGASNYLGDIGGKDQARRDFIYDVKLNQTRWVFGGHIRYKVTRSFSASFAMMYGRVQGFDSETIYGPRRARNLNFRNDILEASIRGEYTFYSDNDLGGRGYYNPDFRVFGFLGLAALTNNPKGYLNEDNGDFPAGWYSLRELKTEGQDQPYGKFTAAIPMGVGVYLTHNKKYRFGWELGYRVSFTDYLDDISGTYAPDAELETDLARALANQTTPEIIAEVFGAEHPGEIYNYHYAPGYDGTYRNPRGINNYNDGYVFTTFSAGMIIQSKSKFSQKFSQKPRYNWFNGRKRSKKSRAKF